MNDFKTVQKNAVLYSGTSFAPTVSTQSHDSFPSLPLWVSEIVFQIAFHFQCKLVKQICTNR